ncbi:Protein of unknown function [Bacillus cytotoxicus]|nr:Protein of unknown function [Bacillus cytotoxicus]
MHTKPVNLEILVVDGQTTEVKLSPTRNLNDKWL